jgi:hypothetical protein
MVGVGDILMIITLAQIAIMHTINTSYTSVFCEYEEKYVHVYQNAQTPNSRVP